MTLRTRLKRVLTFGDSSSDDNASPRKHNPFRTKNKDPRLRDPNIYYQPGEKMPPLKYRRPVAPEHKAKLESFSWNNAWRRRSIQSQYSPMGSRMPSRMSSRSTMGRASMDRQIDRQPSRQASIDPKSSRENDVGVDSGFGGSVSTERNPAAALQENSEEENDVSNVGLSRVPTRSEQSERRRSSSFSGHSFSVHSFTHQSISGRRSSDVSAVRSKSVRSPEPPFTQEELEAALRRSHLGSTQEVSDESGKESGNDTTPENLEDFNKMGLTPVCRTPNPIDVQDIPRPPEMSVPKQPITVAA